MGKRYTPFALGADISWYPQMRDEGFIFRNERGEPAPLPEILRELGFNAVRLRTWVDPSQNPRSAGRCCADETLALALECQAAGMRVMIDFHYSDYWADPANQRKPRAWEELPFDALVRQVYDYTRDTMRLLTDGGVRVEWCQIGNEINPGMLLPDGSTEDFGKLSKLITAGHDGVKAISPQTVTMVHLAEFNMTDFILRYCGELAKHGCRYDMMGFSYYPYHLPKLTREECRAGFCRSMRELPDKLNKDIMIVETGEISTDEALTEQFLLEQLREMATQPRCRGLMLWEPEGAACWSHYPLSAWRDDGTPSAALTSMRDELKAHPLP